jgi:hypothetical protein
MTSIDLIGWAAAALTLLAFTSRDVRLLRCASLAASVAFITYGAASSTWPVLALHAVLLPVSLFRLLELHRASRRTRQQDQPRSAPATGNCWQPTAKTDKPLRRMALLPLVLVCSAAPAAAAPGTYAERMHARAVESFRQGRFPEAYGRFIDLANTGHPASARYALWMCEQGPALFGKDWDCAPHEVEEWARAAGVETRRIAVSQPVTQTTSQRLRRRSEHQP